MKNIYIVQAEVDQWEDSFSYPVIAFNDLIDAENYIVPLNAISFDFNELFFLIEKQLVSLDSHKDTLENLRAQLNYLDPYYKKSDYVKNNRHMRFPYYEIYKIELKT